MKKLFTLIFILSLLLGACTPAETPSVPTAPIIQEAGSAETQTGITEPVILTPPPPPAEISQKPSSEPTPQFTPITIKLVDTLGNELTLTDTPLRIISLAPSITETLYAIGAGNLIVGRTDFDNYPEAVLEIPSVGGVTAETMSMEVILDLEPDLVLGGSVWQADLIDTLNKNGIPSLAFEPKSFAEIMDLMILLGKATGHEEDARTAMDDMETRVNKVASVMDTIPEEERVTIFYEVWHEPLMTTTNSTFIGEIIVLAGGVNIFGELEEDYPSVSAEEIIEANPDVILGPSSHSDQLSTEVIATREGWEDLTAIQNNAIYLIDGDIISRAGPRVVDALEAIVITLYPAYFESY